MATKQKTVKTARGKSKNEQYLGAVFALLKKRDGIAISDKKTRFNDTELRMLSEILAAKYEGRRLISTQLATLLGVTRSAVSQIVNRLEEQGVVVRVPDDVDRKIAYVEVTEATLVAYEEDLKTCLDFIGRVVEKFGEENFKKMCELYDGFMDLIQVERKAVRKKTAGGALFR